MKVPDNLPYTRSIPVILWITEQAILHKHKTSMGGRGPYRTSCPSQAQDKHGRGPHRTSCPTQGLDKHGRGPHRTSCPTQGLDKYGREAAS